MKFRLIALALLCSATLAQAQTKKELATKLLQLQQQGVENVGRNIAAQTSQRALQAAGQAIGRMPADKRDAAAKDAQAEVKKFYDEVDPVLRDRAAKLAPTTLVPLYEEKFNEAELKQIIAWVESPVSKKFAQIDNDVAKTLAQKVLEDSRGTIEPKLKTLEQSLAKRLGVAPPPAPAASAPPAKN